MQLFFGCPFSKRYCQEHRSTKKFSCSTVLALGRNGLRQSALSFRPPKSPLLGLPLHAAFPATPSPAPHTISPVMAVRSKKKGSGQSDDADHPIAAVEGPAPSPTSPSNSTTSSGTGPAVDTVSNPGTDSPVAEPAEVPSTPPPASANGVTTPTADKYV